VYFTDSQVSEMRSFSRSLRRAIRRGAFEIFCHDQPSRRGRVRAMNVFAVLTGLFAAREVGLQSSAPHSWLVAPLVAGFTVLVIEFVFQSWLTERLRPYFQRYIEEHRDEIARVA